MSLNLSLPHGYIYKNKKVGLAVLPGVIGTFGITANHTPIIAELKAGIVQLYENVGDAEPFDKFVISGGFSVTTEANKTDINVVECVKVEEVDPELARKGLNDYRNQMESAAPDSVEKAKAQISYEVHEALCHALGIAS